MKLNFVYSEVYDEMLTVMSGLPFSRDQIIKMKTYKMDLIEHWSRVGLKIIKTIESISGLKFKKENVDCFIVKEMGYIAISEPFTIRFCKDLNELNNIWIHELIHVLLVQNNLAGRILEITTRIYPEEDLDFKIHLPVLLIERKVIETLYSQEHFEKLLKKDMQCEDLACVWLEVNKLYQRFEGHNKGIISFLKELKK